MKLQLNPVIAILLCAFVVLFPVQAAGATEISAAPLNPDLNKSFDEEHTMATETSWTCIESQNDDRNEWNNLTNTSLETDDLIRAFTTNTLRVPTDNYSTIQSAVDAAAAGDTVIVESGTYTENVAITTPLTLRGTDTGNGLPVIDACGNGTTLFITADGVTVEGFEMTGGGEKYTDAGLCVEADNASLINLSVRQNAYSGMVVSDSANLTITGCSADDNGECGTIIDNCRGSTLNNCSANENGVCGIVIYNSLDGTLNNCSADENGQVGILLSRSPGSMLNNCSADDNEMDGIMIEECINVFEASTGTMGLPYDSDDILSLIGADGTGMDDENLFRASSRIPSYDPWEDEQEIIFSGEGDTDTRAISGYTGVSLSGCRADGNDHFGFLIIDTPSVLLNSCNVAENGHGIFLSGAEKCTLMNNSMEGNRYNFGIYGGDEREFIHSIDTSNTVDGKPVYYLLNATGNPEGDFADAGTIYASNCVGLNIHDLTLSGNHCGIYFRNTTSSIITGVTTPENRIGIQLDRSSHNSIVNCRATENGCTGIELRSSEECLLTGNAMDGNRYNFVVYAQEDADYVHSIDTSNTVDGKAIYYLFNATANPEGDFVDAGTIYAFNCTGLDIHDLILSNEYAGVYIRDCSGLDIHDLTLSDNNYGIALGTSTDITLDTIAATENNHGIYLKDCSESTIRGVTAQNNGDGIMSYDSENNHISDCIIEESKWRSIVLVGNRNCIVSYCTVSNSNAYNNYWYRNIHLIGSNNCILFLNSFVKNTTYEEYYSQDILWNSPSALTYLYGEKMYTHTSPVGNYWGTAYSGTDQNGDGIGDSPFIGNGFTDNYPLMEPVDAYTFVKNTGADDIDTTGNNHVGAAGNLNAGDAVTMPFEGAAVTGVTITAAKNINLMTVTVGPVQTGPKGLNGPVYQYLEADLIHTTDDAIAEADFNFSVPKAWLTVQGLTPEDVVLWRYHDGAWVPLPTEVLRDEGDHIVCRAVSPGFSYFAIGEGDAVTTQPVETTPTADAEAESGDGTIPVSTPSSAPVKGSTPEPTVPPEEKGGAAATATPPQQSPAGLCSMLAAVTTAALLFRRH